jgi:hypothetical protein
MLHVIGASHLDRGISMEASAAGEVPKLPEQFQRDREERGVRMKTIIRITSEPMTQTQPN